MTILAEITWDSSLIGVQGWTIFVIGWLVVFIALICLSTVFRLFPKLMDAATNRKAKIQEKKRLAKEVKGSQNEDISSDAEDVITGELTAAIATALHMYFTDLHDDEARILRVEHKSRKYSPWNSKIYNVMNFKR